MNVNDYYHPNIYRRPKRKKKSKKVFLLLIICLLAGGFFTYISLNKKSNKKDEASQQTVQANEPQPAQLPTKNFNYEGLQAIVDDWTSKSSGTYSVVISDPKTNEIMAKHNVEQKYFTASIYKLFVIYLAYQDVASGKTSMSDKVSGGRNRQECLDAAIRSSDSPCAEALMAEIGNANISARIKEMGIQNTAFPGLTTTALDTDIILKKIYTGEGLSKEHQQAYIDSMKNQPAKYRIGLPKGITNAEVANKVGWNLAINWHDTAIIYLNDGRVYTMSILSENAKSAQIADLAKTINERLTK